MTDRVIDFSGQGAIPPTPPLDKRDEGVSLSADLIRMREDERY